MCSSTNQKLGLMQFFVWFLQHWKAYISTYCSFNIICPKTEVQTNLMLANFTGWLKGTSHIFSLFLSVSVSLYLFLPVNIRFCLFLCVSVRFCPFLCIYFCFWLFLSVFVCFFQLLSVSVCFGLFGIGASLHTCQENYIRGLPSYHNISMKNC